MALAAVSVVACSMEDRVTVKRADTRLLLAEPDGITSDASGCASPQEFFIDRDHDGYGGGEKVKACALREGLATRGGDCDDSDNRVHPGQKDYFAVPRKDGSFDFDCDGRQKLRLTTRAFCRVKEDGHGCVNSSGWAIGPNKHIPKCGQPEEWEWTECRKTVVEKVMAPTTDATSAPGGIAAPEPASSPMAPLPMGLVRPDVKEVYSCWSGRLKWKKRQLCR